MSRILNSARVALLLALPVVGRAVEAGASTNSVVLPPPGSTSAPVQILPTNAAPLVPPAGGWLLPEDAEKAYEELVKANRVPAPPAEWNRTPPTEEQRKEFRRFLGNAAGKAADLAKEFALRFPTHRNAPFAKSIHRELLKASVELGSTNWVAEFQALGPAESNPVLEPAPSPLEEKMQAAATRVQSASHKDADSVAEAFEKEIRILQKEYPDEPIIYAALSEVMRLGSAKRSLPIAQEIMAAKGADPYHRVRAKWVFARLSRLDKPFDLEFTAVDGRKVKVSDLRGKVVLLDFWATWCPPCVASVPELVALHQKFQPKGFEIVGISADDEEPALRSFVKRSGMTWPQFHDPAGREAKVFEEMGINKFPTMWLVDRKGILRELEAESDLQKKVEALLAEK